MTTDNVDSLWTLELSTGVPALYVWSHLIHRAILWGVAPGILYFIGEKNQSISDDGCIILRRYAVFVGNIIKIVLESIALRGAVIQLDNQ